jgi:hypothetical protein
MAFPDDLSDILPLLPGTGVTKRLQIFGHAVFAEIKRLQDGKYRLIVYDQYEGQTRKRFVSAGLSTEEELENVWREFLDEQDSIFKRDRASHSMP